MKNIILSIWHWLWIFYLYHDKKVLTVALISLRQTGQSANEWAQWTQVTRWPHGKNTTDISLSIHILQSLASFNRLFSSSSETVKKK